MTTACHGTEPCYLVVATTTGEAPALASQIEQLGVSVSLQMTHPDAQASALLDGLTGLPNHPGMVAFFHRHVAGSALYHAMIYVHLERLESVNASLGRVAGDQVICQAAERLGQFVGKEGGLGRCSDDEFALLLPVLGPYQGAAMVAARVAEALGLPYHVQGRPLRVPASIGIALYPDDATNAEQLMQLADKAAQHVSWDDEPYTFYRREMSANISRRMDLESALWQAVSKGDLCLYYQPKVALDTGRLVGVEALLRWPRTDGDYVSPDEFVPLLEDIGLINTVGAYVLEQACRDFNLWRQQGRQPVPIAVNLATHQLRHQGLPDLVRHTLQNYAMPAGAIELEITESGAMADPERALVTLKYLRDCGVSLTMDDFGTGYSSLSYLQRLPISQLKIDKSFLPGIPVDSANTALVEAILAMCGALNLKVVAEGVENREQANFLLSRGCSYGQGFLFGKAMPANELLLQLDPWREDESAGG